MVHVVRGYTIKKIHRVLISYTQFPFMFSVLARIYGPKGTINHSCHAPIAHAARHVM